MNTPTPDPHLSASIASLRVAADQLALATANARPAPNDPDAIAIYNIVWQAISIISTTILVLQKIRADTD